jgi:endonuclease-8
MPEGHTLFRIARELNAHFSGKELSVSSPQGRFSESAALLDGSRLEEAESAGKHLFMHFSTGDLVHIHLGLIGRFDFHPLAPPVGEVRLRVHDGSTAADLRAATLCQLATDEERLAVLARLGPDPLRPDSDPELAWARISRSDRPIGDLLLDQKIIAGAGNVYRAEVLFRNRIHPLRPGRSLSRKNFTAIWSDLVFLMQEGVRLGRIDTVRPEHTPEAMGRDPRVDDHGGEVYVYRRTGQDCYVCGSRIQTADLAGRNSFWCPRCQRKPT